MLIWCQHTNAALASFHMHLSRLCNLVSGVLRYCDIFPNASLAERLHHVVLIYLYSYESYGRFLPSKLKVIGLGFKLDATDGEKWVKFVAMQQDGETVIYDLLTMKGTTERLPKKKIAQVFTTVQFQA